MCSSDVSAGESIKAIQRPDNVHARCLNVRSRSAFSSQLLLVSHGDHDHKLSGTQRRIRDTISILENPTRREREKGGKDDQQEIGPRFICAHIYGPAFHLFQQFFFCNAMCWFLHPWKRPPYTFWRIPHKYSVEDIFFHLDDSEKYITKTMIFVWGQRKCGRSESGDRKYNCTLNFIYFGGDFDKNKLMQIYMAENFKFKI